MLDLTLSPCDPVTLRIIDGNLVMAYCEQPACEWRAR